MSSKKRRTLTTIETHEFWIVKTAAPERREIFCAACPAKTQMLTPQEAAEQAGVSQRTVFRWIDQGAVHFAETAEGMFVCLAPLTIDAG